jgi:hypothetical protein
VLEEVADRDDPEAAEPLDNLRAHAREGFDREIGIEPPRKRRTRTGGLAGEAGRRDARADGKAQNGFNSSLRASRHPCTDGRTLAP